MARKPKVKEVPVVAPDTAKFLLNPVTGRVLPWSSRLGERADLLPCSRDGVPLRPAASRIAARAERQKEIDDAQVAELNRINGTAVLEVRDTFGAPNNPTPVPSGDRHPVSDLLAGMDDGD
jgi:hypothetical protein